MNSRNINVIMNIIKSLSFTITIIGLISCGSNGKTVEVQKSNGFQQNHGPFDSNGNYVERWADKSPKRKYVSKKSSSKKKVATVTPKKAPPTVAQNTYTPKKTYTPPKKTYTTPKKVTPKKPVAKKITPKTKPPIIHKVVKGDTLYGLSRKYGTSVAIIQKVNSLKGTSITLGRTLIIPRK